jgi:Saxitoxin biosynthesis operon protein SxtJ
LEPIVSDKYFGAHEFQTREEVDKTSSDKGFGLVFSGVCFIVGGLSIYKGGAHWPWWLGLSALFAMVAFLQPSLLAPLNRLWTKFGLLLFVVISPIVLGALFYLCISPIGAIMRWAGKDPLSLKIDANAKSYWILRDPPGPSPDSFSNQF